MRSRLRPIFWFLFAFTLLATLVPGGSAGLGVAPASASSWMWDQDEDGVDDRMERVEVVGIVASYVDDDPTGRQRFQVIGAVAPYTYGVFIRYLRMPTDDDVAALNEIGVVTIKRYLYIPYVRGQATYAQAQLIAQMPGVVQVETVPYFYPVNDNATKAYQASFSNYLSFPTVHRDLNLGGRGSVVAILDSGVNDEPMPSTGYPGHESLRGKFL